MTAFNADDLPVTIDTVEKLAVWAGMVLNANFLTETVIEGDGPAQRTAQFGTYFVPNTNTTRCLIRLSIQVNNNFGSSGGKFWTSVLPLGGAGIPPEFKS